MKEKQSWRLPLVSELIGVIEKKRNGFKAYPYLTSERKGNSFVCVHMSLIKNPKKKSSKVNNKSSTYVRTVRDTPEGLEWNSESYVLDANGFSF